MKKLTFIILTSLLITTTSWASERVNVKVSGMVCSFCAQGISKKFQSHKAVNAVKVDLDNYQVSLDIKDGTIISDEEINTLTTEAGYNVVEIKRNDGASVGEK